jgi:hypothetical protein
MALRTGIRMMWEKVTKILKILGAMYLVICVILSSVFFGIILKDYLGW